MTDMINVEHKLTATEVNEKCPIVLQDFAKRIAAHLDKARKYKDKADQNYRSASQYLAEAKDTCDDGGFTAFREKFFSNLGKSRVYELLQIATNKKSVEEVRTDSRERQAKSRANKKEATANSVTVTENSEPAQEPQAAHSEASDDEDICAALEQTPEPASKPRSAVKTTDESSSEFTALCGRLLQKIDKQKPDRFAATGIQPDKLAKLGKFLMDLAKKLGAKPTDVFVPQGNGTVSAEQSGEDRKALNEERYAKPDLAGA